MRIGAQSCVVFLALLAIAVAGEVDASIRKHTDIPSESLAQALRGLADERGFQIIFASADVANVRTAGAVGEFTSDEALKVLLKGTGFTYRYLDERTVTVSRISTVAVGSVSEVAAQVELSDTVKAQEVGKQSSQDFRLAQATSSQGTQSSVAGSSSAVPVVLQEVIVTAQKRAENLLDVPIPVTAISAQELVENNKLSLRDYYSSIPGLSINSNNLADTNLSIRGVTTGGLTNPTVGVTVDDVPFGSTTALGSRTAAPDLDPSDLAQIEVLRGPQGTLYGASSLGGLLKYVTVDPSTNALTGCIAADLNGVQNGNEIGYGIRGGINVPVGDTFAIRASGFVRRDPGYVDNVETGVNGVNRTQVDGGRIAALWRPSDAWYVKLSALYQDISADGASYVAYQPPLGDLQQSLLGGTGSYDHQIRSFAATVGGAFAGINMVSISGYSIDTYHGVNDLSGYYGALANALYGVNGVAQYQHAETKKFTQELRFSGQLSERFDWLLGGFYTHEDTPTDDFYTAVDPVTLAVPGLSLMIAIRQPTRSGPRLRI